MGVQHSVKFDDDWVMVPQTVTLEGEPAGSKPEDSARFPPVPPARNSQTLNPKPLLPTPPAQDHLGADFEPAPVPSTPQITHPQRIRTESAYAKCLRDGEGTVGI